MHRRTTELRPYRFGTAASTPFGGHARDPYPTPSGGAAGVVDPLGSPTGGACTARRDRTHRHENESENR